MGNKEMKFPGKINSNGLLKTQVFLLFILSLSISGCSGNVFPFDNSYYESSSISQEYAEGKSDYDRVKNDPCLQDIMAGVPEEFQRCGNDNEAKSATTSSSINTITGCVNVDRLNVRTGPSTQYDVIQSLSFGDCVKLTGRNSNGSWAKFRGGWISTTYIDYSKSLSILPIFSSYSQPSSSNTSTSKICTCSYNAYNCKDFSSQSAAQSCYQYCLSTVGYDVHWLDDDQDGKACELNP